MSPQDALAEALAAAFLDGDRARAVEAGLAARGYVIVSAARAATLLDAGREADMSLTAELARIRAILANDHPTPTGDTAA